MADYRNLQNNGTEAKLQTTKIVEFAILLKDEYLVDDTKLEIIRKQ